VRVARARVGGDYSTILSPKVATARVYARPTRVTDYARFALAHTRGASAGTKAKAMNAITKLAGERSVQSSLSITA
jgi:hypothetical protein